MDVGRAWSMGVRAAIGLAFTLPGCGADDTGSARREPVPTPPEASVVATGSGAASTDRAGRSDGDEQRCLVRLHGKGGRGTPTEVGPDGTRHVAPDGNGAGWDAREWRYFPDDEYADAVSIVRDAIEGCDAVIVNGFSNGGAFAAKLVCRAETFDGRLHRVVIDDPVPDHGVDRCAPDPSVAVVLYWTGALAETAVPGWPCAEGDWTCEGGETIGIDAYAEALGTAVTDSPMDGHQWFWDAPELARW